MSQNEENFYDYVTGKWIFAFTIVFLAMYLSLVRLHSLPTELITSIVVGSWSLMVISELIFGSLALGLIGAEILAINSHISKQDKMLFQEEKLFVYIYYIFIILVGLFILFQLNQDFGFIN